MKNSKKIMLRILPIVLVLMVVLTTSVFAAPTNSSGITPELPTGGSQITGVTNLANNIWQTVAVIVQILAIAAIIFAGVRYMFASANDKADIKKQTIILVVGAVLVFAAVPIAQFITGLVSEALK